MNLKNIKIATQLKLGLAVLLLFVIILGSNSYMQTNKIHLQAEKMYNHPLQVRRIIGQLTAHVYAIRVEIKDLVLTDLLDYQNKVEEHDQNQITLELLNESISNDIGTLRKIYLGPMTDIDTLEYEFVKWKSIREETIRLNSIGKKQEAANRATISGVGGEQAETVLRLVEKISLFATGKGDELYTSSRILNNTLNRQLLFLLAIIVLISFLISNFILRAVRKPIEELIHVTQTFHSGNLGARSLYESKNELGLLSTSFNTLAESIQMNMGLTANAAQLAKQMLSEDDARKFFQVTLAELSRQTNSQIAAVYLLDEDAKNYDHFESIGLAENMRKSFSINNLEGEFGAVLSTKKIQHIKDIPDETKFNFYTTSGEFIPKEIITIPILASNQMIAIFSLASLSPYSKQSVQFVDYILDTLGARIEGILAYRKIKEFSIKLEQQNQELESQKTALGTQSSELRERNVELEKQKKQLHEATQLKTIFLSNMSHELRTPLNSVIALSGVLHRSIKNKVNSEEYNYVEVIERNGKHLLRLINDILDISRIEAGYEELEVTKFSIKNLIGDIIELVSPLAHQKGLLLNNLVGDSALNISSDIGKCRHILQNLTGNAIKFTEKGKVEIEAHLVENEIKIVVTDTGVGIQEKHLAYIFDEFRQVDGSTSRRYDGTGLGLSIAKKYATLLGGSISVKSAVNRGSQFTLSLPISHEFSLKENVDNEQVKLDESKTNNTLKESPKTKKTVDEDKKIKVLVVEDNPDNMITVKALIGDRYKVYEAIDGLIGIDMAKKHLPDLILMDIDLPKMDGIQAFKSIRGNVSLEHTNVIALTASAMAADQEKILAHGFDGYIVKPIDESKFFITINEILYGK